MIVFTFDMIKSVLRTFANQMYMRYGAPVYVVGSFLVRDDYHDIDIRVIMSDTAYENRFGSWQDIEKISLSEEWPKPSLKLAYEVGKRNRWLAEQIGVGQLFDFQIQCESQVKHHGWAELPRIRIDDIDEEAFMAAEN